MFLNLHCDELVKYIWKNFRYMYLPWVVVVVKETETSWV